MSHSCFIHSSTDGHLGCFPNLAIVNNTEVNIGVLVFFQISVLGSFGYIPRSGITGSKKAGPFLIFWGISILLSTVVAPVCYFKKKKEEEEKEEEDDPFPAWICKFSSHSRAKFKSFYISWTKRVPILHSLWAVDHFTGVSCENPLLPPGKSAAELGSPLSFSVHWPNPGAGEMRPRARRSLPTPLHASPSGHAQLFTNCLKWLLPRYRGESCGTDCGAHRF